MSCIRCLRIVCLATVLLAAWVAEAARPVPPAAAVKLHPKRPPRALSAGSIDFADMYRFGPRAPAPTPALLALDGRRVTLIGFMALLERPARGGFFLAPYPAVADESGAGRGDLPPTSVLVLPAIAAGREIAFVPGALEITGTLEVGNRESDGESSTIRLRVDADDLRQLRFARTRTTNREKRPCR